MRGIVASGGVLVVWSVACMTVFAATAAGETTEEFYRKTRLTVAIGSGPGGSHDLNCKLIARHIGKHLPGNPTVIPQNMPGAGSLTLANHLYNMAPKDGSYFGGMQRAGVFEDLYEEKAKSRAKFDATKLNWLGSPDRITGVAVAWHTSPVKTYKDLYSHEMVVGTSGGTTTTLPLMLRRTVGFQFKIVKGYKSGGDVDLAMERGEIEGRIPVAWGGLKSRGGDWLEDKKVTMLFQTGLTRHSDLPNLPLALEFAKNDDDRKLMELFFAAEEIGYPYAAPPGLPDDRLAVLRKAFADTMADKDFIEEARRQKLDVNPVTWQQMTDIVKGAFGAPPPIIARLREAIDLENRN
jgi:tripartite-type tricarboxylate transporter receptor subunit TctC